MSFHTDAQQLPRPSSRTVGLATTGLYLDSAVSKKGNHLKSHQRGHLRCLLTNLVAIRSSVISARPVVFIGFRPLPLRREYCCLHAAHIHWYTFPQQALIKDPSARRCLLQSVFCQRCRGRQPAAACWLSESRCDAAVFCTAESRRQKEYRNAPVLLIPCCPKRKDTAQPSTDPRPDVRGRLSQQRLDRPSMMDPTPSVAKRTRTYKNFGYHCVPP